jgi:2-amino-4-hydroxy-6-hydroxymethyldihydropteridine diphosphokinase
MGKKLVLHLGSNCGNRMENLRTAIEELNRSLMVSGRESYTYQTAAWGKEDQDDFYNVALVYEVSSDLDALEVLKMIIAIEKLLKRERFEKWGPRIIDIDIIYLGTDIIKNKILEVPHPLLQERRFVLEPLADIVPDFEHPLIRKSTKVLLAELDDPLDICRIS